MWRKVKGANMSTTRGECKLHGGKLVGVTLTVDDGRIVDSRLDGDFFISTNSDDISLVRAIEHSVNGAELPIDVHSLANRIDMALKSHPEAQLIGATSASIATAIERGSRQVKENAMPYQAGQTPIPSIPAGHPEQSLQIHANHLPSSSDGRSNADHVAEMRLSERWSSLHPLVIHDSPRDPAMQMALDEVLSEKVADGTIPATFRIWEWKSSAVIIGRFQSLSNEVDLEQARRENISVVRRVTGGGAMFVEPSNTITYSLYAPLSFVEGMDVAQSYRLCDEWLVAALRELGMKVSFSSMNDLASEQGKIGGAAQRRFARRDGGPGAVLHHVTLAYDIDAEKMARVLRISKEKMSDKAVRSVVKRVDPMRSQTGMARSDIISHLQDFLLRNVSQAVVSTISPACLNESSELAKQRYSKDAWLSCIV